MVRSTEEEAVIQFVTQNEPFIKMNVFGVVQAISKKVSIANEVNTPAILEDLYKEYLAPLIRIVKKYFKSINTKYYRITILADSLDTTWNSDENLEVQSQLILSLLEIDNKLKKELIGREGGNVELKQIIFLRKDIYDYILKFANEPDKLTTMSHEINWEKYPDLLKKVIGNRFKYILNLENESDIERAWKEFFNFKGKEHPFKKIERAIIRRPRDVIYFVSRLFESAVNQGHEKVNEEDFVSAIDSYMIFLNNNLIAEVKAEYPEISKILAKLQENYGETLEYKEFLEILESVGCGRQRIEGLVEILFKTGYMVGYDQKTGKAFSSIGILKEKLKEKNFFFFKNKVYVIAHAKYFYIRNKHRSSF